MLPEVCPFTKNVNNASLFYYSLAQQNTRLSYLAFTVVSTYITLYFKYTKKNVTRRGENHC